MNDTPCIRIHGAVAGDLAASLSERVEARLSSGEYSAQTVSDIAALDASAIRGELQLAPHEIEKLRRLCQVWDIELRVSDIRSHRRFVGPIIVAVKRLLFRLLRVLLKDVLHQQREFNAAAIAFLGSLLDRRFR